MNGYRHSKSGLAVLALWGLTGIVSIAGDEKKDKAGQLLDNLLRPAGLGKAGKSAKPLILSAPLGIEDPAVPLTAFQGDPPKGKPIFPGQARQPRPLQEDLPFVKLKVEPIRPRGIKLPPGTLIRLQGPDVNQPIPLPVLGKLQPDRAPLTDPTLETSTAAALKNDIPERVTPAPFVRLNLPDPFENGQAVRLRTPPPEDPNPPTTLPRTPKK